MNNKLDKTWFYNHLSKFNDKYVPIFIDIPINKENMRYRLIYSWRNIKPDGSFNPLMSCQLVDITKQGWNKYVVPDLNFDCIKENTTTQYKLFKYLSNWIDKALKEERT